MLLASQEVEQLFRDEFHATLHDIEQPNDDFYQAELRSSVPEYKPLLESDSSLKSPRLEMVPCWFPVFLSAVFAAAPWLPYRFSVRTMLIVATLVALVLGAIVYAVRQVPLQFTAQSARWQGILWTTRYTALMGR